MKKQYSVPEFVQKVIDETKIMESNVVQTYGLDVEIDVSETQ